MGRRHNGFQPHPHITSRIVFDLLVEENHASSNKMSLLKHFLYRIHCMTIPAFNDTRVSRRERHNEYRAKHSWLAVLRGHEGEDLIESGDRFVLVVQSDFFPEVGLISLNVGKMQG